MQAPSLHVEQAEPLFLESVSALDALAPPFSAMDAFPKSLEFFRMFDNPAGESMVVGLLSDPPGAGTSYHEVFNLILHPSIDGTGRVGVSSANHDGAISAVDFLSNPTLSMESGHFWKQGEFGSHD